MMNNFLLFIAAFLIGSIPFGILFARFFKLGDLRKIGSGNIGATNVLRTGNKPAALLTLVFDGLKGFVPVFFMPHDEMGILATFIGALLGHCYSPWLGFRGGKGVATYIGALFGVNIWLGLIGGVLWLGAARLSHRSSLSALIMVAIEPFLGWLFEGKIVFFTLLLAAILIFWRHQENIKRLINGVEDKIKGSQK